MCWEQSHLKRTIATSRSDDDQAQSNQVQTYKAINDLTKQASTQTTILAQQPRWKPPFSFLA
jgi:hypothetical protein